MSDYFIGEIRAFSGAWTPSNWLPCDGRSLLIQKYNALFALLGVRYGGDGKTNFNIPDLRGRFVAGCGVSPTLQTNGALKDEFEDLI
jgi:microcystin-dependent protein